MRLNYGNLKISSKKKWGKRLYDVFSYIRRRDYFMNLSLQKSLTLATVLLLTGGTVIPGVSAVELQTQEASSSSSESETLTIEPTSISGSVASSPSSEPASAEVTSSPSTILTGSTSGVNYTFDTDTGTLTFEGGTLTARAWGFTGFSKADVIHVVVNGTLILPSDSSYLFEGFGNLIDIDTKNMDTSNVTNMYALFMDDFNLITLDLSSWDTRNVINMAGMFSMASNLTNVELSTWVTNQVTNMGGMFEQTSSLISLSLPNFDTSNVTSMRAMFAGTGLSYLNISNWNTSNTTDMNSMFSMASNLTNLDLSSFDTSKIIEKSHMLSFVNLSQLSLGDEIDINGTNLPEITANTQYTGYWVRAEHGGVPITSTQLMLLSSIGGSSGTWVRQSIPVPYNLSVVSGIDLTNMSPYVENDVINLQADVAPTGKVFDKWISDNGGSFGDENNPTTTFKMPAGDTTVTAIYKDITPLFPDYVITANNLTYSVNQVKTNPNLLRDSKAKVLDKNGVDLDPNSSLRLFSTTVVAKEGVYTALIGVGDDGRGNPLKTKELTITVVNDKGNSNQSDNNPGQPSGDNESSTSDLTNMNSSAKASTKWMSKLHPKKILPHTGEQSSPLIWIGLSILMLLFISAIGKRKNMRN
jgi:LPXTG-motif cell wall-anchored protein